MAGVRPHDRRVGNSLLAVVAPVGRLPPIRRFGTVGHCFRWRQSLKKRILISSFQGAPAGAVSSRARDAQRGNLMSEPPYESRRIATHPDQRDEQLAWAVRVLREIERPDPEDVRFACEVILAISRDPAERTVAQELQRHWRQS